MQLNYLPLFPTPGAPITATLTSPKEDFFLRIPRIPPEAILFDILTILKYSHFSATWKTEILL